MNVWQDIFESWHSRGTEESEPRPPFIPVKWITPEGLVQNSDRVDLSDEEEIGTPAVTADESSETVDERDFAARYKEEARQSIASEGMEAIAFYAPVHFYGKSWGVYFNEKVFFGTCAVLSESLGEEHWDSLVMDLLRSIEQHEMFHAACELFALVAEDFARLSVIPEYLEHLTDESGNCPAWDEHFCVYSSYFEKEYSQAFPREGCVEESLATAFQLAGRFDTPDFLSSLQSLLETSPPAYRNWVRYEAPQDFAEGVQSLARKILDSGWKGAVITARPQAFLSGRPPTLWFPDLNSLDSQGAVPRLMYRADGARPARFARLVVANVRTNDLLSAMCRQYQAEIVSGGKHQALVFPNGKKVPFPTKGTVPVYLVGDIARAIGISKKDVLAACGVRV